VVSSLRKGKKRRSSLWSIVCWWQANGEADIILVIYLGTILPCFSFLYQPRRQLVNLIFIIVWSRMRTKFITFQILQNKTAIKLSVMEFVLKIFPIPLPVFYSASSFFFSPFFFLLYFFILYSTNTLHRLFICLCCCKHLSCTNSPIPSIASRSHIAIVPNISWRNQSTDELHNFPDLMPLGSNGIRI
jgi:hypothetical protein